MNAKAIRVTIAVLIIGAVMIALLLPFKRPFRVTIVLPPVTQTGL